MTRAYPRGTVSRLVRTLQLDPDSNTLQLRDDYTFKQQPTALEEAFITFDRATVSRDGRSVRVGSRALGLTLRAAADTAGVFAVTVLEEESRAHQRTDDIITRITFVPEALARQMSLSFVLE